MRIVKGNILDLAEEGYFDIVVHGCNCFCTMGAGIAKEISSRYPVVLERDKMTGWGDSSKMGTIDTVDVGKFSIVNAYTQYRYGRDKVHVDYHALYDCFKKVYEQHSSKRIAYPLIGAGLAGGDWGIIAPIIDNLLKDCHHTLVVL